MAKDAVADGVERPDCMGIRSAGIFVLLASLVRATALPAMATPATAAPVAGLHYLVGSWKCTYRAGTVSMAYDATYVYDLGGHALRQYQVQQDI